MSKIFGILEKAQIEHVSSLPVAGVGRAKGRIVYLTTDDKTYISDGTDWHESPVLDTTGALQLSEIATPATPASGKMKVYPKSDNFLYSLDDTGAERKVGSGSGADTFYFEDFESGVYSAFTASGSFALANGARATTAVLDGTKEAKFTRGSSADTVSWSVPIPVGYNPAIVRISFLYETDSSYADNDIEVHVLNGATELGVVGYQLKAGKGKHICEFQTDAASADTTYTLRFKQATAGTWTNVYIDDLTVAAREIARGSVVTDWVAGVSPSMTNLTLGNGSLSTWHSRSGDTIRMRQALVFGSTTSFSSNPELLLPTGLSLNTSKRTSSDIVGRWVGIDTSAGVIREGYVRFTTALRLTPDYNGSAGTGDVSATVPFTWANTDELYIEFSVPVTGWSSNAVISSDFGGRIIAASAYRSGTQTGVNPNASAIKININSKTASGAKGFDTTNSFDAATNFRYDVAETGYYKVNGTINVAGTNVLNNSYYALIKVSGTTTSYGNGFLPQAAQPFTTSVDTLLYLTAGQYVELFLYGAGNNSASTLTVGSGADSTYFEINKISSPQTLMGSEVVATLVTSSTTTIAASAVETTVIHPTVSYDTHNAYNTSTGIWTCPVTGKYSINTGIQGASLDYVATSNEAMGVAVNGTTVTRYISYNIVDASVTKRLYLQGSGVFNLVAGDTVRLRVSQANAATNALTGDASMNWFSIEKTGL